MNPIEDLHARIARKWPSVLAAGVIMLAAPLSLPSAFAADCSLPALKGAVVSVLDYGAHADGTSDDTKAIQRAVDAVADGGIVQVPAGTYRISVGDRSGKGVTLKGHMTLRFADGAVWKALASAEANSQMLRVWGVTDTNIVGGTLVGERDIHTGSGGEWGMGIDVRDSSGVTIVATTAKAFWGDGLYLGGKSNRDITICGVTADGNRRNGLSVVTGDGVQVLRSTFRNTQGTSPEAGIDVEPNNGGTAQNVVVADSMIEDNAGDGIALSGCEECALVNRRNSIVRNTIRRSGKRGVLACYDEQTIADNVIEDSAAEGIKTCMSHGTKITGNVIRRSHGPGILLYDASGSSVKRNRLEGNTPAIEVLVTRGASQISNNDCNGGEILRVHHTIDGVDYIVDNVGCTMKLK